MQFYRFTSSTGAVSFGLGTAAQVARHRDSLDRTHPHTSFTVEPIGDASATMDHIEDEPSAVSLTDVLAEIDADPLAARRDA